MWTCTEEVKVTPFQRSARVTCWTFVLDWFLISHQLLNWFVDSQPMSCIVHFSLGFVILQIHSATGKTFFFFFNAHLYLSFWITGSNCLADCMLFFNLLPHCTGYYTFVFCLSLPPLPASFTVHKIHTPLFSLFLTCPPPPPQATTSFSITIFLPAHEAL